MTSKYQIHVVDDDAINRQVLKKMLENDWFEVSESDSGRACLQHVAEHSPDIILLDIMMPGMSGFKTCRELKTSEHSDHIPVIFITAIDDRAHILEAFRSGGADYITKPFSQSEIMARIDSILKRIALQRDRRNLLKINQAMVDQVKNVVEGFSTVKTIDGSKSDLVQDSATLFDLLEQVREAVMTDKKDVAVSHIDTAQMSLQFIDRVSQQLNEFVKVIHRINGIVQKHEEQDDLSDIDAIMNASSSSVLSKRVEQDEVDDLLSSLGI
jgi:DNA-binding response OmpR family regulator